MGTACNIMALDPALEPLVPVWLAAGCYTGPGLWSIRLVPRHQDSDAFSRAVPTMMDKAWTHIGTSVMES